MNTAELITFYQVLNLVYELTEDGTHMPKCVGVVIYHTSMYNCNLCIGFVCYMNIKQNASNK